jgi:hypothetical protein
VTVTDKPDLNGMTKRQAIKAFLLTALADGALAVRDLEAKARAGGLLAEGLPISQSRPIRRIADKLHVLSYREDDPWWWRLPMARPQDGGKVTASLSSRVPVPDAPRASSV